MATFIGSVELAEISCKCGGVYAITERHRRSCQETGGSWTCPYCQTGWGFVGNSDNAKLKKEVEQNKRWAQQAQARARHAGDERDTALRQKAAAKGQVTKLKNRAAAGVCPCCNRTFKQLATHMQMKHPEWNK